MQLDGLAGRRPHELSGGQRQRVALARALARSPKLLLLDEAFSAVDQPTRQALYDELVKLRERVGIPIVMVTHDLREARLLADRLCILEGGTTLQDGPPEYVLSRPRNAHVAALVGLRDIHSGIFHRSRDGQSPARLRWGDVEGIVLTTVDKGRIDDGTPVRWVIAGEYVHLHLEPPDGGVNVVACVVERAHRLGDITTLACRSIAPPHARVHVEVTTRQAREGGIGGAAGGVPEARSRRDPHHADAFPRRLTGMSIPGGGRRCQGAEGRSRSTSSRYSSIVPPASGLAMTRSRLSSCPSSPARARAPARSRSAARSARP
jgi:molybdate transport system ATP-binding protein